MGVVSVGDIIQMVILILGMGIQFVAVYKYVVTRTDKVAEIAAKKAERLHTRLDECFAKIDAVHVKQLDRVNDVRVEISRLEGEMTSLNKTVTQFLQKQA